MMNYIFLNEEKTAVGRIDDDGLMRSSGIATAWPEYLAWIEEGNEPLPIPTPIIGDMDNLVEAKKVAAQHVKDYTHTLLQPTDWVVVREIETGVGAPANITSYRTSIREESSSKVSIIEGKQNLSTLQDYLRSDEFAFWPTP